MHQIVGRAQDILPRLPERERLPTNALFSAYDEILPNLGVDADHDSRYARVLFKIGGLRGPGTLFEKFEEVLSRLGIEIEWDGVDATEQLEAQENAQYYTDNPLENNETSRSEEVPNLHRRRNSEGTAWDLENLSQLFPRPRRNSHSSGQRNGIDTSDFVENVLGLPPRAQPSKVLPGPSHEDEPSLHGPGSRLASPVRQSRRRERSRSTSTHGSLRIHRRPTSEACAPAIIQLQPEHHQHHRGSVPAVASSDFGNDAFLAASELAGVDSGQQAAAAPESLMQIKASVVLEDALRFLAKKQLRQWRDLATQQRDDNLVLYRIGERHYNRSLLRDVLRIWLLQAREKLENLATERFFEHLEQRAERARDLFLMSKYFIQWSNYTYEEIERTVEARQFIICRRVFNAWQEITAVNELKVRRHVLKRFFTAWRRKQSHVEDETGTALQVYDGGLIRRIFSHWAQKRQEVKAVAWWAEETKRRALLRWIAVHDARWEDCRLADEGSTYRLTWNSFAAWRNKTQFRAQQREDATTHHNNTLRLSLLRKWRRETQIIPAQQTLQTSMALRLLRHYFDIWLHRTRQEKEAAALNKMRILREAYTIWRLRERSHLVANGLVYPRLKAAAMVKLRIAAKLQIARLKLDNELKRRAMQAWLYQHRVSRQQRQQQENVAQSFAVQRAQNLALAHWYAQMDTRKRLELVALDVYVPRLCQGVLTRWSANLQHQQKLQRWARDAQYYFLTTKTLKRWRESTESMKREKRKTAFTQVRKLVRVNLILGILRNWQHQARYMMDLNSQAIVVRENKNVIIGMEMFDRWRGRAEELSDLDFLWKENILRKHFTIWRERSDALRSLETEAVTAYHEHRQSRVVRKWSLASLQLRSRTNVAEDVCEKNAKKTFRKMFNYWRQKAMERRPLERVEASDSDQLLGTTARAEAWSEYGGEAEGEGDIVEWATALEGPTSTHIPGYLATPSRRSTRFNAVTARFSSTPKAPLSTPLEKRLRAQYSGGSSRRGGAKGALGMGGFEDIPETSINNGKESRGT